jgi:hypothetical protein
MENRIKRGKNMQMAATTHAVPVLNIQKAG